MRLGGATIDKIPVISTGSLSLDIALGVGGFPKGRVAEIYGPESSGKTTLALHVVAEAQKAGGTAAFIDAEHALDTAYAKRLGVDVDNLLVSQPDFGEQALEIAEILIRSIQYCSRRQFNTRGWNRLDGLRLVLQCSPWRSFPHCLFTGEFGRKCVPETILKGLCN